VKSLETEYGAVGWPRIRRASVIGAPSKERSMSVALSPSSSNGNRRAVAKSRELIRYDTHFKQLCADHNLTVDLGIRVANMYAELFLNKRQRTRVKRDLDQYEKWRAGSLADIDEAFRKFHE
jgi:hypothetical protein